jgi:molybdopterin/thiamine biosynthesis adenylyltransferase
MDLSEMFKYGKVKCAPTMNTEQRFSTNVHIVGCGGTGSRLIPLVAQAIAIHNQIIATQPNHKEYLKGPINLVLYDCDEGVELKNLERQGFIPSDIGKRKEVVLAERYGACFGIDITYVSDKIKYENTVFSGANNIFCDCTDNLSARRAIEDIYYRYYSNCVLISGGNGEDFGQAMVSFKSNNTNLNMKTKHFTDEIFRLKSLIDHPDVKTNKTINILPTLLELYPEFKDTEGPSCDEVLLRNEQSMPINNLVATLMYNIFYSAINGDPFTYNMVKCNLSNTFDTKKITHPKAMFELLVSGVTGSKNGYAAIEEWRKLNIARTGHFVLVADVVKFLEQYKKKALNIVNGYILDNWKLTPADHIVLNNAIKTVKEED